MADRLPAGLGDLHPDDGLLSTIEGYVRHAAGGKTIDQQPSQLTDSHAVYQKHVFVAPVGMPSECLKRVPFLVTEVRHLRRYRLSFNCDLSQGMCGARLKRSARAHCCCGFAIERSVSLPESKLCKPSVVCRMIQLL
jgi:hypothetical protein